MTDRELRYNRDFLNWKEDKFKNNLNDNRPLYHINPSIGLLNDPNCVFFYNNELYIFFQHHPANQIHGLKTMSLAKTKDFVNFEYINMVNKPVNKFESHGIYTGNAIVYNNIPICIYTGNQRDENWNRTSNIVISRFDVNKNEFIDKKVLIKNKDFNKYTEHFRDPYIFEYDKKLYFILGAQDNNLNGKILLFSLNENLDSAILINELSFDEKYRMIECPNVIIENDKAILIYSPQYKENAIDSNENPDIVRYTIIDIKELFVNTKIEDEKILDYGFEYYAPQTFKIKDKWYIIGWVGIPTSNNYLESKNGWIHTLSNIREVKLVGDKLYLIEQQNLKTIFNDVKNPKTTFYKEIKLNKNQSVFLEGEYDCLEITYQKEKIFFKRDSKIKYNEYNNVSKIHLSTDEVLLDIYYDNSVLEIKINDKYWFTSRLYLGKDFKIRLNNEQ